MPIDFSARSADNTPRVWLVIGGQEYKLVDESGYSYSSDVLTLTDTGTVNLANPDGQYSGKIKKGASLQLYMSDPAVNGGASVLRLTGIVTNPRMSASGGEKIQVQFSDLGWHLENCDAPLYIGLYGNWNDLLRNLLQGPKDKTTGKRSDRKWGFQNAAGNIAVSFSSGSKDLYTALNQGRQGFERSALRRADKGGDSLGFIPPIQSEAGMKIGQILVDYARRAKLLVNIESDGFLVFFQPNYSKAPGYTIEYHASTYSRRSTNNIIDGSLSIDDPIDGEYTDVSCCSTTTNIQFQNTTEHPNATKTRGRYRDIDNLPFYRQATFSDGDQMDQTALNNRAIWYFQRGKFDSWTYTCDVHGHSQGGIFWVPNTMVSINDTVHNVVGNYYLQAVTYVRSRSLGTRCKLTLKKPNLLGA